MRIQSIKYAVLFRLFKYCSLFSLSLKYVFVVHVFTNLPSGEKNCFSFLFAQFLGTKASDIIGRLGFYFHASCIDLRRKVSLLSASLYISSSFISIYKWMQSNILCCGHFYVYAKLVKINVSSREKLIREVLVRVIAKMCGAKEVHPESRTQI